MDKMDTMQETSLSANTAAWEATYGKIITQPLECYCMNGYNSTV